MQADRVDRSAVGWDHREQVARHESQARQEDFKTGLAGAREEESGAGGAVGTNYVKTKPESRKDLSCVTQHSISLSSLLSPGSLHFQSQV